MAIKMKRWAILLFVVCSLRHGAEATTPPCSVVERMHFPFAGSLTDLVAGESITQTSGTAWYDDSSRGTVLDLYSTSREKFVFNSALASSILGGNVWTMSVWLQPVSVPQLIVLFIRGDYPTRGPQIYYVSGALYFRRYCNGQYSMLSKALTAGTWYHIAFVADQSSISLYVNGGLAGTDSAWSKCGGSYPTVQGSNNIVGLGSFCYASYNEASACPAHESSHDYAGLLQDLRLFDSALSASEVNDVMGTQVGLPVCPTTSCCDRTWPE